MKYTISILLLLKITYAPLAQNIFFKPDQSGTGLGFQISSNDESVLFGFNASYTHNGRFTGGVSFGLESNDKAASTATSFSPHIDYLLIKQYLNDKRISINMGLGYQFSTIKIKNYQGPNITGNALLFNLGLYYEVPISSVVSIIPSLGFGFAHASIDNGYSSSGDSASGFSISSSLLVNKFYFTPAISFSKGRSSLSFLFGIVVP